jgi:hypothetical protein
VELTATPPGPPGKLVVAHPDRKAQRTLQRLVGATLCPVEVVADDAALIAAVDAETIAIVDAGLAQATPALRDCPARAWIAVPGEGLAPAEAATVDALLATGWWHVVAHPMPILAEELLATVQKLIRKERFGLEKYMAWGAEVRSYTLEDARERDGVVSSLAKDVIGVGLPERVGSLVSVTRATSRSRCVIAGARSIRTPSRRTSPMASRAPLRWRAAWGSRWPTRVATSLSSDWSQM